MASTPKFIVGTSGYSFRDWIGTFYPADATQKDMFGHYVRHFETVELNFTYYRLPTARTIDKLARSSPEGFTFWVKANQETTHKHNRAVAGDFLEGISPLVDADKLAGVLLQFPQSFHRTVANRRYLAAALDDFAALPRAVEFRHHSWQHPATPTGLRERSVSLVIPDAPDLPGLYHHPAAVTTKTGYFRLHSRNADKWYAGGAERYDYNYTRRELTELIHQWSDLDEPVDQIFAFFNNCHHGQAAENAEAFQRILAEM